MKRLLVAGVAIAAFCGAPVLAADLPTKAPEPAPAYKAPLPAALLSWTGWYGGLNGGYIDANGQVNTDATSLTFPSDPTTTTTMAAAATNQFKHRSSGFLGGVQFGYNYQWAPQFVVGVEADFQGSSLRGDASTSNSVPTNTTFGANTGSWQTSTTVSRRLDYLGTVRARVGVASVPNLLIYATGGLAYGGVKSDTSMTLNGVTPGTNPPPGSTSGSYSGTRTGWTVGGGLEWMFLPRWSTKVEYLYYDLGSATYATGGFAVSTGPTSLPGSGIASVATSTNVHFNGNIVRVGLNYKFGP
jgi:outer membrane immunogenic protein